MGLLLSINGVDFEPYAQSEVHLPLVNHIDRAKKARTIQRDLDHPEEFQKALNTFEKKNTSLKYKQFTQKSTQNPTKATYAYNLMSEPVITLDEESNIEQAKVLLAKYDIRHLPVVSKNGNIVGMLSDRNIAFCQRDATLKEIMTLKIIAAEARTLLYEITRAMIDHKINSIPILSKDRAPIGIITSTDILRSVLKNTNINLFI